MQLPDIDLIHYVFYPFAFYVVVVSMFYMVYEIYSRLIIRYDKYNIGELNMIKVNQFDIKCYETYLFYTFYGTIKTILLYYKIKKFNLCPEYKIFDRVYDLTLDLPKKCMICQLEYSLKDARFIYHVDYDTKLRLTDDDLYPYTYESIDVVMKHQSVRKIKKNRTKYIQTCLS